MWPHHPHGNTLSRSSVATTVYTCGPGVRTPGYTARPSWDPTGGGETRSQAEGGNFEPQPSQVDTRGRSPAPTRLPHPCPDQQGCSWPGRGPVLYVSELEL